MARHQVEFANAVVRAGERELLDFFVELVWPAFSNQDLAREWGETTMFFEKCRPARLGSPDAPEIGLIDTT